MIISIFPIQSTSEFRLAICSVVSLTYLEATIMLDADVLARCTSAIVPVTDFESIFYVCMSFDTSAVWKINFIVTFTDVDDIKIFK